MFFLKSMMRFKLPFPFLIFSHILVSRLLDDCLDPGSLPVLAAPMLRQTTAPTPEAVNIGRLHAPPALSAVDVGPAILARTRATHVTVDIGHVSPDPALVTMVVIISRQLQG